MLGLPDVASSFQSSGFTVLLYDPRNTGQSTGEPRNEIDPMQQASDYSDAVTFLVTQAHAPVDPSRCFLWGMSFSAAVALCAGALDPRVAGLVAVAPLTDFTLASDKRDAVLARCAQDRASQIAGNEPFYLPMVTEKGENPAGFGVGIDRERYAAIVDRGKEIARGHVNRTTLQSYYKMLMWQPFGLWESSLLRNPVLMVVPELDRLSPAERQVTQFEKLKGSGKRLFVQKGVGHMDIVEGEHFPELMQVKVRFLREVMEGRIAS
ncbi:acetyltransferase fmaC [Aspergillus affinis]|uniref:acetyltransferase fmaC n=1 Tax=Aspergillus affinis TaxID=1070780 RepID=UPI0022FF0C0B|nr:alpha/beta-hydrolase [Aspergillus affinis]KAI9035174.1 alpha/beta-hydrolase [Aspergillus affinis]